MSKEIDNTKIMVLDRCFSDQRHKYSIDDLLDNVNEFRYDVSGPDSTIKERTLRKYISRIRNMLPSNVYLESRPYDCKKCYYRYSDPDFSIYNSLRVSDKKTSCVSFCVTTRHKTKKS